MLKAVGDTTGAKTEGREGESHTLLTVSWSDFYGSMLHNGEEFTAADLSIGQVLPGLSFYSFNSQLRGQLLPVNKKVPSNLDLLRNFAFASRSRLRAWKLIIEIFQYM